MGAKHEVQGIHWHVENNNTPICGQTTPVHHGLLETQLPAHSSQAIVSEDLRTTIATWRQRSYGWCATGRWVNLHAAGARIQCSCSDQHEFYHFDMHSNFPLSTAGSDSPATYPVGFYPLAERHALWWICVWFLLPSFEERVTVLRKSLSLKIGPMMIIW